MRIRLGLWGLTMIPIFECFFPSEDVWPKLAVRSPGRGSVLQKLGLWALGGEVVVCVGRTKRLLGNNGDKDRSERFTGY